MKGPGTRVFIGMGLEIPSDNILTESPWTKINGLFTPHRHFYISDGAYKMNFLGNFLKKEFNFLYSGEAP